MGNATEVDYIKVTWSATGEIVETVNNVAAKSSHHNIQEGSGVLSSENEVNKNTFTCISKPKYKWNFQLS